MSCTNVDKEKAKEYRDFKSRLCNKSESFIPNFATDNFLDFIYANRSKETLFSQPIEAVNFWPTLANWSSATLNCLPACTVTG